jgi:hypothetical protein
MIVAAAPPVEAHLDLPDALHRDMLARRRRYTDLFSVDSVLGYPGYPDRAERLRREARILLGALGGQA